MPKKYYVEIILKRCGFIENPSNIYSTTKKCTLKK